MYKKCMKDERIYLMKTFGKYEIFKLPLINEMETLKDICLY